MGRKLRAVKWKIGRDYCDATISPIRFTALEWSLTVVMSQVQKQLTVRVCRKQYTPSRSNTRAERYLVIFPGLNIAYKSVLLLVSAFIGRSSEPARSNIYSRHFDFLLLGGFAVSSCYSSIMYSTNCILNCETGLEWFGHSSQPATCSRYFDFCLRVSLHLLFWLCKVVPYTNCILHFETGFEWFGHGTGPATSFRRSFLLEVFPVVH